MREKLKKVLNEGRFLIRRQCRDGVEKVLSRVDVSGWILEKKIFGRS